MTPQSTMIAINVLNTAFRITLSIRTSRSSVFLIIIYFITLLRKNQLNE